VASYTIQTQIAGIDIGDKKSGTATVLEKTLWFDEEIKDCTAELNYVPDKGMYITLKDLDFKLDLGNDVANQVADWVVNNLVDLARSFVPPIRCSRLWLRKIYRSRRRTSTFKRA